MYGAFKRKSGAKAAAPTSTTWVLRRSGLPHMPPWFLLRIKAWPIQRPHEPATEHFERLSGH